jgi:steroid 5-alpha reductase family enzyme
MMDLLTLFGATAAVALTSALALWLASIPLRDVSIIDMFFALIIVAITLTAFALAPAYNTLQWVLLAMVLLWALRITAHLIGRNWGHGEDPRYTKLRSWVNNERAFLWLSLRQVFLLQAVVLWLASLPVQVGLFAGTRQIGLLAMLGSLLWLLGLIVETVADAQLRRFRAQPENRGTVLCTGLWRYSRHPNYFGELCVWWGIWLVACEVPLGWLTVVGPLAYSYLVVNVTGQKTLDKKLAREKPGYAEYMARTSGLIPLPPKRPA